jgi:predicted nucleotidyltransferase component of viral defense system
MRLTKSELLKLAKSLGYRPEILEKVIVLINLLNKFFEDDFLKNKFALKGGTALNLFLLDLPRLSVDIDLNYIGSANRDEMLEDKAQVQRRISTICNKLDIKIDRDPSDEHSGGKFLLSCEGALNQRSNLELDLNYILRVPIFKIELKDSIKLDTYSATSIPLLNIHEITAGKLAALFSRNVARDLYDVHQLFCKKDLKFDQDELRLAFLVYGAINKTNWLEISLDDISFNYEELKNNLLPVLSSEEVNSISNVKPWAKQLQDDCIEALKFLFPFTDKEKEFIESINKHGEIKAELLTSDLGLQSTIQLHPALQWKALTVKKLKSK